MMSDEEVTGEGVVPNESDTAKLELDAGHPKLVEEVLKRRLAEPVMITTRQVTEQLRNIARSLQKNYPDPNRITVPVSRNMVIHQDFHREVATIPDHIAFPRPALVNDKALRVGTLKVPAVFDRKGVKVKDEQEFPVYVAADSDGSPLRDSKGDYVVIDPQTGCVRQQLRSPPRVKQSWLRGRWRLFKVWLRKFRFHFRLKFIERVR